MIQIMIEISEGHPTHRTAKRSVGPGEHRL